MLRQSGPTFHDMAVENCAFEELDDTFKRFVEFWYRHRGPNGAIPPIDALDEPDAPLMWMGGGVLAVERNDAHQEVFRFRYAARDISDHAGLNVEGCVHADMMSREDAEEIVALCARVLRGGRPHYWCVENQVRKGEGYVMRRVYAPFAGASGEPAYLAGLWRFLSG